MEFRILGPLEVRGEAGALVLGGIKPRALLAVLLLHADEPVSADRLAPALWDEDAPHGEVKTVQVHVSRGCKALGDAEMVVTTPVGHPPLRPSADASGIIAPRQEQARADQYPLALMRRDVVRSGNWRRVPNRAAARGGFVHIRDMRLRDRGGEVMVHEIFPAWG